MAFSTLDGAEQDTRKLQAKKQVRRRDLFFLMKRIKFSVILKLNRVGNLASKWINKMTFLNFFSLLPPGKSLQRRSLMRDYFLRRFLLIPPTLFGISIMVFAITRLAPGGPLEQAMMQMQQVSEGAGAGNAQ